ncbi:PhnD/SsuA/transferrin family substrate-binding protein [Sulfitobacter mediterraneus]|uniref:PhnD/SsuA/transferrin family substrate-binding protein n=1 Tax=Sulfitobacter mediterraneus TaxID=83219 RepID=UPI0021A2806A|nr:PhnD/SsuA/transferrin family substrate-binding protein [Sulfitobacter mediterraneus]UWR13571.1 PhnD/SsuA/transferrin family substrate-binding protein [Sulfitobacter mediterraneus]
MHRLFQIMPTGLTIGALLRLGLAIVCAMGIMAGRAAMAQGTSDNEIRVGILATEGATRALEAWTPTIDLLNNAARNQSSPYRFKIEPHTDLTLLDGIADEQIDLFLGDPATFVVGEVESGARALLSVAHMWNGVTYDETGAVVFVRADSDIRSFEDVSGRPIMGVAAQEMTGWQLAQQEFRKSRLEPDDFGSDLMFSGGNQREVVYAVQTGLVDVGVIRAGVLENLAKQGALSLDDFRPLGAMDHDGYPFWVSTPLYPDWVISAVPDVPEEVLALVINSLLSVTEDSDVSQSAGGVVWQAPQNYQTVHELLISLRARPYENYLRRAATRIYSAYQWPVIGLGTLIVLSLAFLAFQVRRNAQLAEARKNVLQSEVRSKQFYRNAIEDHTVFCMLTKDGVISHVNERFLSALDRPRGSLLQNHLAELLNETNQSLLETEIMASMQSGAPWQGALQLTRRDDKAAWVQCTFIPVTSASNTLSEIAIVASDVTETRTGVSESRFNNTLELIQDQVIVMRPGTFELMYVNTSAHQLLIGERMGGSWKGKKASDFITKDDFDALKMRAEATIAGPQRRVTWEVEGKFDVTYEISLEYAQPEQDEPRLIVIYRDISERKAVEKAKNEFIATVSHELRTPLTSMKGALGLAVSGAVGEVPEKMTGVINMAASNCDRLVTLINDILDLEKISSGKMDYKMQAFDLNTVVSDALEANKFYAEKFDVTLRRIGDAKENEFRTYGDATRLTQVMDNLMSNAAKFSHKGSEILVSLSEFEGRLRISIRDFGDGIPEKAQATIFDKFTQADSSDTRSKGGTGLGLSIVKLIVEHHKGRIAFVSKEGIGTEFFVDLPMLDGDTVVPISRKGSDDNAALTFTDTLPETVAIATPKVGETAIDRLVTKSRETGTDVKFELGRVNALQVAKGRGVVGQSTVLNWMSSHEQALMVELLQREEMENCDVSVIELTQAANTRQDIAARNITSGMMVQDWLRDCGDLLVGEGGETAKVLAISSDDEVMQWLKEHEIEAVKSKGEAVSKSRSTQYDVIAQFGEGNDAATLALLPMQGGRLPSGWPVTLIVSKTKAKQASRGVVSKFSSGGGRGRRRA